MCVAAPPEARESSNTVRVSDVSEHTIAPISPASSGANLTELKRSIGTVQLTLFGVGSMLGAGIYGLIGKAAGVMGSALWMGFLLAMIAALLTGISYASIASRYPRAAGAAYVTQRAYGREWLSYLVGLTVVAAAMTSIATQSRVVAENFNVLLGFQSGFTVAGAPAEVIVMAIGFGAMLAAVVYRGINEALWVNAVCTVIEASGLLMVVAVGMRYWGSVGLLELPIRSPEGTSGVTALVLLQGSILTFFSFLGFEDMLNVSEEVKQPERTLPIALISAMLLASVVYIAVAISAVSIVPWAELALAPAPLQRVMERAAPWFPSLGFTVITITAVANTALVNYVMGSRLLYGMARQGLLPSVLGRLQPKRQTPFIAVLVMLALLAALQFAGGISALAGASVLLLLAVFMVMNVALVVLKRRDGDMPGRFNAPLFVPIAGALICAVMIGARVMEREWRSPILATSIVVAILALYFAGRRASSVRQRTDINSDRVETQVSKDSSIQKFARRSP